MNRAYCVATGDKSQEAWDKTPEWQQESALVGVKAHLSKELSPRESHEAWAAHKLADGWSWGLTKDADKKKHPCLVPYDSLPITQRVKDYLFTAVVKNMR
ncbi:MAG: RyR domain-containing protein [Patescibacteria group bacterium]|nr:RyR domain-containing protein [Patescibacteria group bacterium]